MILEILSPYNTIIEGPSINEALKYHIKMNHRARISNLIFKDNLDHMYAANMRFYTEYQRDKVGIDVYQYPFPNSMPNIIIPPQPLMAPPYPQPIMAPPIITVSSQPKHRPRPRRQPFLRSHSEPTIYYQEKYKPSLISVPSKSKIISIESKQESDDSSSSSSSQTNIIISSKVPKITKVPQDKIIITSSPTHKIISVPSNAIVTNLSPKKKHIIIKKSTSSPKIIFSDVKNSKNYIHHKDNLHFV